MQKQSIKKQTVLLTLTNALVRALGFVMRIVFSRVMGPEAIGVMELASSVHMLAITPVTAGVPLAMSRMTAQTDDKGALSVLNAGYALVKKAALIIMPLMLLTSPLIARLLGDTRTLPSIWVSIPCVLVLGYSAALNGYCYGRSNAAYPALSELVEQAIRFSLAMALLFTLTNLSLSWFAAIPPFATMVAEAAGLVFIHRKIKLPPLPKASRAEKQKLFRLALPQTLMRLCNTGLKSLNAIVIPLRLRAAGYLYAEATARFGMLTGMVMPVIYLPSVATGALSMISAPKMAALENNYPRLKKNALRFILLAGVIGILSAVALHFLADFISRRIYRLPELAGLIRFMCPSVVFSSLNQVLSGMIAGIGRQKHALYGTIAGAVVTLGGSFLLTAQPQMNIYGAALGMMLGQCVNLVWSSVLLAWALKKAGDKSV